MIDIIEEASIIVKDCNLPANDKAIIEALVYEHERLSRILIATNAALCESQRQHIAVNEQLIEMKRKALPQHKFPKLSASISGHIVPKEFLV